VPDAAGGPPAVFVYRRVQAGRGTLMHQLWRYEYDPEADPSRRLDLKWPWSKPTASDTQTATPTAKHGPADE
jgi:hypothetical protein